MVLFPSSSQLWIPSPPKMEPQHPSFSSTIVDRVIQVIRTRSILPLAQIIFQLRNLPELMQIHPGAVLICTGNFRWGRRFSVHGYIVKISHMNETCYVMCALENGIPTFLCVRENLKNLHWCVQAGFQSQYYRAFQIAYQQQQQPLRPKQCMMPFQVKRVKLS